jgi:hypothetical protein
MQDHTVTIKRNANCNFLFDYIENNEVVLIGVSFETIQDYLGIESENYSNYDDNRYLMII